LLINADAQVLAASLNQGARLDYAPRAGRVQYLVAPSGALTINGLPAAARDGVAIAGETQLVIEALADAEIVLVDTAA
jgi:redox-sensitive bicupin YhaK (pirin superfamily)